MKRKFGDRANWRRIISRQFACQHVKSSQFTGYLSLYTIHSVKEPLFKTYGRHTFCIADKGYSWLQYYPKGEHFVVTAMFDEQNRIIEWYIDTCHTQGMTDQGVPWFDDLYLDVVVLKEGEVFLLDEDELEAAFLSKQISKEESNLAKQTAHQILKWIDANQFPYFDLSLHHRETLFQDGVFKK